MPITPKGRATRDRIIEGAATFLREHEFGEISLDDVRAVTGTSKGQLFHYFPDGKDELLLAVMRHEADRVLAEQQPHLGDLSTWPAWQAWREVLVARYRAQGTHCPLNTVIGRIGSTPGAAEVVRALLAQWQGALATGIRSMQASGCADPDIEADRLAGAMIAAIQGGVVVMRSTGSTEHLESALDVMFTRLRQPQPA
jgi:AcrR family transcriptional regulator